MFMKMLYYLYQNKDFCLNLLFSVVFELVYLVQCMYNQIGHIFHNFWQTEAELDMFFII